MRKVEAKRIFDWEMDRNLNGRKIKKAITMHIKKRFA